MLIRRENPSDAEAIDAVHRGAFAPMTDSGQEPVEVGLVHALRSDPAWVPAMALVAEGDDGSVVGHVVATVGTISAASGAVDIPGLGPLGVDPARQAGGVGAALMHAVLAAADALGYPVVVLLGDPGYYRRFGFGPAAALGIAAPDPAWGDHFQARALDAWRADLAGPYRYASPFDEL